MIRRAAGLAAILALPLAACAPAPIPQGVDDPFESGNRRVHAFNKGVDRALLRPAASGYGAVPAPVREGARNVAGNLQLPRFVVNDIAQGEGEDAVHNLFRFILNSTLGVAGLFDPAASFGLPARETGFGETLHVWGVGEGPYLELPLLGPSTARDAAGGFLDVLLNPLPLALEEDAAVAARAAALAARLDARLRSGAVIDEVLDGSADSYATLRSLYLQNRRFELGGGRADYLETYEDPYDE